MKELTNNTLILKNDVSLNILLLLLKIDKDIKGEILGTSLRKAFPTKLLFCTVRFQLKLNGESEILKEWAIW